MAKYFCVSLVMMCCVAVSLGFPGGAPESACTSMTPNHDGRGVTHGTVPFELLASELVNGIVTVTLKSTQNKPFKGFLIRAVFSNDRGLIKETGEFVGSDTGKLLNCTYKGSSVTHSGAVEKFVEKVQWKPNAAGTIKFRATVVEGFTTRHYESLFSNEITI